MLLLHGQNRIPFGLGKVLTHTYKTITVTDRLGLIKEDRRVNMNKKIPQCIFCGAYKRPLADKMSFWKGDGVKQSSVTSEQLYKRRSLWVIAKTILSSTRKRYWLKSVFFFFMNVCRSRIYICQGVLKKFFMDWKGDNRQIPLKFSVCALQCEGTTC